MPPIKEIAAAINRACARPQRSGGGGIYFILFPPKIKLANEKENGRKNKIINGRFVASLSSFLDSTKMEEEMGSAQNKRLPFNNFGR